MCSSQNKRIISSGIYVANEKYSTKSKIVTPTLANCWCGIMIEEIFWYLDTTYQIPRTPTSKCHTANHSCVIYYTRYVAP